MEETVELFASLTPIVLLGLILMMSVDALAWLLRMLGILKAQPAQNDAEIVVVLLAGVVISLLLVILRALERIVDTMDVILSKVNDLR